MQFFVKTLAGSLLAAAAAMWLALPGAAQGDRQSAPGTMPAASQSSAAFAGEASCLTCHKEQTTGYHDSAHGRASSAKTPIAGRGCESCHGPGRDHAASGDITKIRRFSPATPPGEINAQCLGCHTSGTSAMWEGSAHDVANTSCATCHSMHAPKSSKGRLKGIREVETCERCHRSQVQKLRRTSHMPVEEGTLACSSCHNPHGAPAEKLLRTGSSVNDTCQRCHAEKRGPYLWEHAPVVESCTTCHDAHGSTNDRMLVAKEPFLCQRCHVTSQHPPTVYDGFALSNSTVANRMSGRSCAACHQNVHGSNAPSGKAFLR